MTAMVYGCEVDYAVVEPGDLPPEIVLQPRQPGESACDPRGTYMITTGRAPRKMPIVDFGNLPLQRAKVTHVVLYNRTGIATPFRALLVVVFFWGENWRAAHPRCQRTDHCKWLKVHVSNAYILKIIKSEQSECHLELF